MEYFMDTSEMRRFSPEKMAKLNLFETEHLFCDVYCLEAGQQQKVHQHAHATKLYYVIEGRGEVTVGTEVRELNPGQVAAAPPGRPHGVFNRGPERLVMLVVMAPNPNVDSPGGRR